MTDDFLTRVPTADAVLARPHEPLPAINYTAAALMFGWLQPRQVQALADAALLALTVLTPDDERLPA
jgi:hypothetical protein